MHVHKCVLGLRAAFKKNPSRVHCLVSREYVPLFILSIITVFKNGETANIETVLVKIPSSTGTKRFTTVNKRLIEVRNSPKFQGNCEKWHCGKP
jgi:hypothetical protein